MESGVNIGQLLLLLSPLILLSLGLTIYALVDLFRAERRVKGGNKWVWAALILLVSTVGPTIYLLAGREEA